MGLAFLITADNLQLLSERKVLKAHEYAALLDAADVLKAARAEALRIRADANASVRERHRQGYDAGWAQAQADFATRYMAQAWSADGELHAQRETLARVIVAAIARFLADVPTESLLAIALERVDALLADEPAVTMCVAPAQVGAATAAVLGWVAGTRRTTQVSVVADPELGARDCRLLTASGHIDIGLDAQIDAFRRSLPGAST